LLALGAWLATACGGGGQTRKPDRTAAQQPVEPEVPGRLIAVEVDETNLLLADEQAARDYLRRKLIGLAAQRLVELGFDGGRATRMARQGRLGAFAVRGHEERVMGQGKQAGRIEQRVLWDVAGELRLVLGDAEVAALIERLGSLPLDSMEAIEAVETYLARLDALQPEAEARARLGRKVGDRWAELLKPWLAIQVDIPVVPLEQYLDALGRVALVLADFKQAHPEHPAFAALEKAYTLAALKALRQLDVRPENFTAINRLLSRVEEMAGDVMPGLMPYLKRDLELAWRDHLVALDERDAPFTETRKGFLYFLELFPESQFYPDLELRFLARWFEHLQAQRPQNLEQLAEMRREINLLEVRFPRFGQLDAARQALGRQCVRVLGAVEADDLDDVRRIQQVLGGCKPYLPAGHATVEMRDRIDRLEQTMLERRRDERERHALGELVFLIEWDRAIRGLEWGAPRGRWMGEGAFARLWRRGRELGEACGCSLDPAEPCRAFEPEGSGGGFEAVARFQNGRLAGIDLCGVLAGERMGAVYRFLARRYNKHHLGRDAAAFLAGGRGGGTGLRFDFENELQVELERSTDQCSLRYRSVAMLDAKQRAERAAREKAARERARARRERIERGWTAGSCVRWDCEPVCTFRGRTKTREGDRYLITITRSRRDPDEAGNDVWVAADRIYDCP
jgi:hypothetical protein